MTIRESVQMVFVFLLAMLIWSQLAPWLYSPLQPIGDDEWQPVNKIPVKARQQLAEGLGGKLWAGFYQEHFPGHEWKDREYWAPETGEGKAAGKCIRVAKDVIDSGSVV